jgi:hypothetical protein
MSTTDLQPPIARDIPRAAADRMRHDLRSAVVGIAPQRRWSAPARRTVVFGTIVLITLTFAALASTGVLRRGVGDLWSGEMKSPADVVADIRSDWTRSLTEGATDDPTASFPNPPAEQLQARLAIAAKTYGFRVREVTILHPRQDAPAIVVESDTPKALIAQAPVIIRMLDPKSPGADNEGWSYEGFFLEIVDTSGRPVMVIDNTWRSPNAGGTQWVAPAYELPYPHG